MKITAIKIWVLGVLTGVLISLFFDQNQIISILPKIPPSSTISIFLKNSFAALTTIFLGVILCHIELVVYKGVSGKTYSFLERLTDPLYKILGKLDKNFLTLRPFFRSCYFYLIFIPSLSMILNGTVFGLLVLQIELHAIVEVLAMLLSGLLGFYIFYYLREEIINFDLERLEEKMTLNRSILSTTFGIQLIIIWAAYLEVPKMS